MTAFREFEALRPAGGFRAILADPPWRYENWSWKGEHKNAAAQYECMDLRDIKALPVESLAAKDAALFLWATFPMLPEALATMAAWGFTYKTGAAWAKQSKTGRKLAFGTGYLFRSAAELLLVGTRGDPQATSKSVRNLILAPVREHSRKPDQTYDMVEQLFPGPRLELFARQQRHGWMAWGNQVDKFDPIPEGPRAYDECIRAIRAQKVAAGELPRIEGVDP